LTLGSLLAVGSVLAMLSAAIWLARARGQDPSSSSDQSLRILLPALAFSLSVAVYGGLALLGWEAIPLLIGRGIILLLLNGVGSLVLISVTDIVAVALGARRRPAWLLIGVAVLVGGAALALLAPTVALTGRFVLAPDLAALMILAAAAALIWWSFLPVERPVAMVFD
jgi:hypothetical protein